MQAIVSTKEGARLVDLPRPTPAPHELLVRVRAIGMNRIDLAMLQVANDQVIGMEWAGEVEDMGAEVTGFQRGDRVMCTGAAAYAEYAVADAGRCVRMPDGLDFDTAASLMLGLQTMHDALVTRGGLQRGSTVLIHGAASVMGLVGMQLARALGAAQVLGTSRNAEHRAQMQGFDCDVAVDSSDPQWSRTVLDATGGAGANIVIDHVSGDSINQCMAATAINGRIVNVGRLGGANANFDFNLHALRRIVYTGVTFRTRSREEVRELNARMAADATPLLTALRVPIAGRFAFKDVAQALTQLADPVHFGKLVLTP